MVKQKLTPHLAHLGRRISDIVIKSSKVINLESHSFIYCVNSCLYLWSNPLSWNV